MNTVTMRADALSVGQSAPPLERTLSQMRMIAYAGATWDWHRLHYDSAYAQARNLPTPVVDGQMLGALLAEMLIDWLGPRAFIRRLAFRLRGMVFAGDTVRCEGTVTAIEADGDSGLVAVAMRIRAGDRLVVEPASAEISLPRHGSAITPRVS
ncbi:MAG: MaoC family dehydratase [Candidatus Binataceae bacterium]